MLSFGTTHERRLAADYHVEVYPADDAHDAGHFAAVLANELSGALNDQAFIIDNDKIALQSGFVRTFQGVKAPT
jgi:hypothetical protein